MKGGKTVVLFAICAHFAFQKDPISSDFEQIELFRGALAVAILRFAIAIHSRNREIVASSQPIRLRLIPLNDAISPSKHPLTWWSHYLRT